MDEYWQWMVALVLGLAVAFILAFPKLRRARPTPELDVATDAAREPIATRDDGFAAWFCERSQATGMDYTRDQAYRMYQAWCQRSSVEIVQGEQLL